MLNKQVSENLRNYRVLNKLTQEQMADKLGMERTTYGKIENGERDLTLSTVERYAQDLEIDVVNLLGISQSYINSGSNNTGDFSAHGINTTLSINVPKDVIDKLKDKFFS